MTTYFTRDGYEVPADKKIVLAKGGQSGHYLSYYPCRRCGGRGGWEGWRFTGVTCYRCGASTSRDAQGLHLDPSCPSQVKVYTAERLAKLNAAADAKAAKRQAEIEAHEIRIRAEFDWFFELVEAFALVAYPSQKAFLESVSATVLRTGFLSYKQECAILGACERITKQRIAEAARSNEWVGKVGERIERRLTVERMIELGQTQYGWVYINILSDAEGNTYKYKGGRVLRKGLVADLRFTIKDHEEYKGRKQTVIARMAVQTQVLEEETA